MRSEAVRSRGEAAPSDPPPAERTPADVKAYRDAATYGLVAAPTSELFAREVQTVGGCERAGAWVTEHAADQQEAEHRLVAAIAAGSRSALKRLHRAYFLRLAKFFRYLTATSASDIVDDLVTDTMFDVWRKSATIENETSVYLSIMRLAYAHGSKRLAESDVRRSSLEALSKNAHRESWLSSRPDPPRDLPDVFANLRVAERAAVYLVYSGHSRVEVTNILGMSCESVDAHLASSTFVLHPWFARESHPIQSDC